jgi:hypothetical protein
MRAQAAGKFLDLLHAFVAAFLHDVRGTELAGKSLPVGVAGHGDDTLSAHVLGCQDAQESHGAITHHRNSLAGSHFRGLGGEPARAQHIGGREQRGDLVSVGDARGGHQGAVGQGNAHVLRLRATHTLPVHTPALVAGTASFAGVV